MSSFRSRTLWSLFAVLIASPLFAQDLAVAPQAPPNAIPEGTRFLIRLNDKLDTRDLKPGKHFKAKLSEDLVAGNGAVIPRGKTIKGTVFGDATFLPNGQLQPRYVVFKVVDGKTAKLEALP